MKVGTPVMVIAKWEDVAPTPPIGFLGEITEPRDADGDYLVLFEEWPCPVGAEPDWICPGWALVPLDEGKPATQIETELTTS